MTIDKQRIVRENRQAAAKAKLKAELESLRNAPPMPKAKVEISEEMEDYEEQEHEHEDEEEEEDEGVTNVVLSELKDFGEQLEKPKYEEELSDIRKQLDELKRAKVPMPMASPFEILKGKINAIAKQLPTEDAKIFRKVAKNYNLEESVEENLKRMKEEAVKIIEEQKLKKMETEKMKVLTEEQKIRRIRQSQYNKLLRL